MRRHIRMSVKAHCEEDKAVLVPIESVALFLVKSLVNDWNLYSLIQVHYMMRKGECCLHF